MNFCRPRKAINLFKIITNNDYDALYNILNIVDKDMYNNLFNEDGYTPLMLASKLDRYDIVELLLDKKFDPNSVNKKEETALHLASKEGHEDIVYLLLRGGANPNCLDSSSKSPIEYAIEGNFIDVVVELCKYDVKLTGIELNNLTNTELRETIEYFLVSDGNDSSQPQKELSSVYPAPSPLSE